jgi:hypothetical protein
MRWKILESKRNPEVDGGYEVKAEKRVFIAP